MATRSNRSYAHVARTVYSEPWALLPSVHRHMIEIVSERLRAGRLDASEIEARLDGVMAAPPSSTQQTRGGSIAVLPLYGLISQRAGMMQDMSGGTSTEAFTAQIRQLAADPGIVAIVIDVDSPGGGVSGVEEAAQAIFDARATKPIVAVSNSLNASAAYWLSSQAHEVIVSPSSETGSIGVYTAHLDESAAHEMAGERVTLISAGEFKTEGNSFEPLSDEARAEMQGRVDRVYVDFLAAVARGRGVKADAVRAGYGQGRVVGAKQAVALGLADRVDTLEGTIARLSLPQERASVMRGGTMRGGTMLAAATGLPASVGGGEAPDSPLDVLAERLMARLAPQISALLAGAPTQIATAETPGVEGDPALGIDVEALFGAIAERMKGSL